MAEALSHQIDVYGARIHLARNKGEWKRLKKSTGLNLSKIGSIGLTEKFTDPKTGQVDFAVYVDVKSQTRAELLDVCAHEAAHVSGLMLDHIDTPYDGTSEPLAYLVGWVTAWLWSGCE